MFGFDERHVEQRSTTGNVRAPWRVHSGAGLLTGEISKAGYFGNIHGAGRRSRDKIFHSKSLRENHLIEIAPSILSADFARLAEQVAPVIAAGATVLHVDVMDGHFVPNITIGPPVVAALRKAVEVPLDVHLMIENADDYIAAFVDAGANWISVHQEACVHLDRVVEHIRSRGALAGVVINPATPVATLTDILDAVDYVLVMSVNPGFGGQKFIPRTLGKIRHLAELRAQRSLSFRIEVDGGIALDTISAVVQAGGEILVAGNAVFGRGDSGQNVQQLLQAGRSAMLQKA
jgi:ribulose-phosphate 3-epimerase